MTAYIFIISQETFKVNIKRAKLHFSVYVYYIKRTSVLSSVLPQLTGNFHLHAKTVRRFCENGIFPPLGVNNICVSFVSEVVMYRRIISVFTAFCAVLAPMSLFSCSAKSDAAAHVFYYSYSDTYITGVRAALDSELESAGISFRDHDGNSSQTTQSEQVRTALTSGARVLAVNIVTTGSDDAASGIVALARERDTPIIFFNREVSDEIVNGYEKCIFIGTDAAEAGRLQGDMIGKYLVDNFESVDLNGDGKISYVLFMGEKGNNEAILRTKYSVENANAALSAAGRDELVFYDSSNADGYLPDLEGKWSAQAAGEFMTTILTSYNEQSGNMVELVICNNDNMAQGAVTALAAAGYNTGDENSTTVPVFGVDATEGALALIEEGRMTGTVRQDAEAMSRAISLAVESALSGEELLSRLGEYDIDESCAKVRIHYEALGG